MKQRKNKSFLMPIEIKPDGKSGMYGGAYCLAFVYSPRGNFLIKGYYREVSEYIKATFNKGLVNYSLWLNKYGTKTHRSIWKFIKSNATICEPDRRNRRGKSHKWTFYKDSVIVLKLKRLPKSWISEFNQFYE